MDGDQINEAIIASIGESAIPRVGRQKLIDRYGRGEGSAVADRVVEIVREAVAMPINWGDMTLAEGVSDIMGRFSQPMRWVEPSVSGCTEVRRQRPQCNRGAIASAASLSRLPSYIPPSDKPEPTSISALENATDGPAGFMTIPL